MLPLVSDAKTVEQTLGFLVSLAVHNFSLSGMFLCPDDFVYEEVDVQLQNSEPMLKFIRHPGAFRVLFLSMQRFPEPKAARLRYTTLRLLERLTWHSHRNHAVLTSLDLIGPLFSLYYSSAGESAQIQLPKQERQAVVKLLKRLMELGSDTTVARTMFQKGINENETLNSEVLEVLRTGTKTRWPEHLSMEGPAAISVPNKSRGLPSTGFTLMLWLRIERFPVDKPQDLFSFQAGGSHVFSLQIHPKGVLGCQSAGARELPKFKPTAPLQLARWTHITLVHYPHRAPAPTVRLYSSSMYSVHVTHMHMSGLFMDGVLADAMNFSYPKAEGFHRDGVYTIGDATESATMSWALASSYFLSTPLGTRIYQLHWHQG